MKSQQISVSFSEDDSLLSELDGLVRDVVEEINRQRSSIDDLKARDRQWENAMEAACVRIVKSEGCPFKNEKDCELCPETDIYLCTRCTMEALGAPEQWRDAVLQLSPTIAGSDAITASNIPLLESLGIETVVSITSAVPEVLPKGVRGVVLYVPDEKPVPPSTTGYILGKIVECAERGRTLVHCWAGKSRSVAFAVGAVAVMERGTFWGTLARVRLETGISSPHTDICTSVNDAVKDLVHMYNNLPERREPLNDINRD